jgi:predicted deacylase
MIVLQQHQFAGSSSGPHVLITGGVHGDEFEPMAAIRKLCTLLEGQPLKGKVTLVPVVNEAAFRRGSRVAEDGLDLARTCPGKADGSVTEQTAFALSQLIQSSNFYIDLHTGGTRLQVLPLAGYTLHPDPIVLDWQRKMAVAFGLPIVWGTDYRLNGRSLSVARDAKVPGIYAEYLGGGGCDAGGVTAYVEGCLSVLSLVGVLDRPVSKLKSPPQIFEDGRINAGYMQINHPAPIEGFFDPTVSLGQAVKQGQPLGTVSDPVGRDVRTVEAAQAGLVLTLHTFARVDAGECLGVILETETKVN